MLITMIIHIRNVQRKNTFLQIQVWKTFRQFTSLFIFHHKHYISPRKLFSGNWFLVIQPSRFSVKPVFKKLFRSFAAVPVFITDKQYVHDI